LTNSAKTQRTQPEPCYEMRPACRWGWVRHPASAAWRRCSSAS